MWVLTQSKAEFLLLLLLLVRISVNYGASGREPCSSSHDHRSLWDDSDADGSAPDSQTEALTVCFVSRHAGFRWSVTLWEPSLPLRGVCSAAGVWPNANRGPRTRPGRPVVMLFGWKWLRSLCALSHSSLRQRLHQPVFGSTSLN